MADRQIFVEGVLLYETGEEEYFVEGVQITEDQPDEGGGNSVIPHAMQGLGSGFIFGSANIAGAGLHNIEAGIVG